MRNSGLLAFVLFIALAVLPANAHATTDTDKEYIDDVRAKLAQELAHLSSQDFHEAAKPQIEAVQRGKSTSFPLKLDAGVTYALVGACDKDCTHVVISLEAADGRVLMRSPERHHTVIVSGTPEQSGRYTAVLSAPSCSDDDCYVGLLLLRKGALVTGSLAKEVPAVAEYHKDVRQDFASYDNYDLVGTDIRELRNTDLTGCAAACETDRRCVGYSFDKWNRYCFLKSGTRLFRLEPNTTSGLRPDAPKPTLASAPVTMQRYRNKAFPYGGQETRRADSLDECEARCAQDTACVALTFFKASQQCRLMHSTGEYFPDPRADSSIKRQDP
jgi:hypothetical protein